MDRQTQSVALEKQHVHDVYERIAPHFSDTRYKAWPRVKEFLLGLEPGSIVADVGCGNGKYLGINKQIYKVGSDCCSTLVSIAHHANHEAMVCDNIRLPYRDNSFDAVISIAVIHHFATTERRAQALNELARICRPGGQIMIYVWAMEQKLRKFDAQDVLVPWHLQTKNLKNKEQSKFLPHHFVSSGSPSKEDPRRKPSQKAKIQSYSPATDKSISLPNHVRVPFIPNKHSTEMTNRSSKLPSKHFKELLRTNSDQGYDPFAYAEKNHFKRLLLPTRSDSVDEDYLNISTEVNRLTCQEVCVNETSKHRSRQSVFEDAGPKKRGLSRMFSFDERLPKEESEETSLIESLTSTATQLLRAISRQNSLEIEKQPAVKEVKGKGVAMSIFSKSLVLQQPEKPVVYRHTDKDVYPTCYNDKDVKNVKDIKNGYSQGNSNCAIDTFTRPSVNGQVSVNNVTASVLNDYQMDTQDKPDDINQMQPSNYDTKTYNSKASIQFKQFPSNQPIIGINCLTAQGELYHESHPFRSLPHMSVNRERDSSVDSVSSSDDSLTAFPVEMSNSDKSLDYHASEQRNKVTTRTFPDNPSMKSSEQTKSIFNGSKHVHDESKANGKTKSPDSSEDQSCDSTTANDALLTQDYTQCNGSASIKPVTGAEDSQQHKEAQESSSLEANCKHATGAKPPCTAVCNGDHQDQNTFLTNCPENSPQVEDKPIPKNPKIRPAPTSKDDPSLYLRYYHVFREGELVDLIEEHVDSLHILRSYYDHANWCVIAEKVQVWTI